MNFFHRLLSIGCLALAAYSTAQTAPPAEKLPSHATIKTWLQGDDQRLLAWGAHDVLLAHDKTLILDLLNLASQWQPLNHAKPDERPKLSQAEIDARDAMAAVVDTLIQMHAAVPAETVRNLAPDFSNAAAILLSRLSADDAEPLAFNFYRDPSAHSYGLQYVSASMLALRPPSGFAADLLSGTTVRAEIFVTRPGEGDLGGGGSAGDCVREENVRHDWPSTGQYHLRTENSDGAVLVVGGIDPIYATREQSTGDYGDSCPSPYLGPGERRKLIAEMLAIPSDQIPWRIRLETTIEYISREQFDFELRRFVDEQETKYHSTATALAARGLMTVTEADQSAPRLNLVLSDMRGSDATDNPIIELANLPPNVEFSNSPWK